MAERVNKSIRDLLKKPFFEKAEGIWMDVLPTITKQYNTRVHTSTKLTPIQASKRTKDLFTIFFRRTKETLTKV